MKKLCLLVGVVSTLVLMGCSLLAPPVRRVTPKLSVSENDLTIDGVKITGSGTITIPAGAVTGGDINKINDYEGVFSVSGRNLTIPAFEMGQYEVTQRLYKAVMDGDENSEAEPSRCQDINKNYRYYEANEEEKDLRPVENVTWYDAVYFCNKLSEKTGKNIYYNISNISRDSKKRIIEATVTLNEGANGYRLPTEAEWEYAARGANPYNADWNKFFAGKGSSKKDYSNKDLDSVGWYSDNRVDGTTGSGFSPFYPMPDGSHRVGLKAPVSENMKLYDMSGNVCEWCYDWYDTISDTTPLVGPVSSTSGCRVTRGGSCSNDARNCSVVYRSKRTPNDEYAFCIGFRVVCSVEN